jgi:PucR C-terminal helix-turn-helix domain
VLFETFQVWQDNDASINNTAQRLFCHPNTERRRLRRIEPVPLAPKRSRRIMPDVRGMGPPDVTDANRGTLKALSC